MKWLSLPPRPPLRMFIVFMDTGIISLVIRNLPYSFAGKDVISDVFFVTNVVLWLSLVFLVAIHIWRQPAANGSYYLELSNILCLPAVSISLTTIYDMLALSTTTWSHSWQTCAYVVFWINTFLALLFMIVVLNMAILKGADELREMEPTFLLSGIAVLTNAAGGGVLSKQLTYTAAQKVPVILVSYLLLGTGSMLALILTILIFARIFLYGVPSKVMGPSVFVLIGPWGQSSFAFFNLGQAVSKSFSGYNSGVVFESKFVEALSASSILVAILLYGVGWLFFIFAVTRFTYDIIYLQRHEHHISWSLAWWSIIFPIGVWTSATEQLAVLIDSGPLKVWACVLVITIICVWLANACTMLVILYREKDATKTQSVKSS